MLNLIEHFWVTFREIRLCCWGVVMWLLWWAEWFVMHCYAVTKVSLPSRLIMWAVARVFTIM